MATATESAKDTTSLHLTGKFGRHRDLLASGKSVAISNSNPALSYPTQRQK